MIVGALIQAGLSGVRRGRPLSASLSEALEALGALESPGSRYHARSCEAGIHGARRRPRTD
jgi:hypothetical protein